MLKNGQTCFKNLAVVTFKVCLAIFQHYELQGYGLCQTSMINFFCKNSEQLNATDFDFDLKVPS